jgi:aspartyl aminopeptidase
MQQRNAEAQGLVDYLNASPTAYHSVAETCRQLRSAGFTCLEERQPWTIAPGGRYFFTRDAATVVAFAVGRSVQPGAGFIVVGAHTDSPCPKVKPVTTRQTGTKAGYLSVGVEPYGGGIWATWFDRDLGVAGRVLVRRGDGSLSHHLVHIKRPILRTPSLAIHLNREVNSDGFKVNVQTHLVRPQSIQTCSGACG